MAELLRPRDGLVLETVPVPGTAPVGAGPTATAPSQTTVFGQEEGPLASYRRQVEILALSDGQSRVRQVVELEAGIVWWSWLLGPLLRWELGRLGPSRACPVAAGTSQGNGAGCATGAGAASSAFQADGPVPLPWWAPPQRLDTRSTAVIAALAALAAVQGFIGGLLPQTLAYAATEMRFGPLGQGVIFGAVELAALPALLALVIADRRGRRGVVLWSTAAAVVLSEMTALAPSAAWLAGWQVVVGALLAAGAVAAIVLAIEEVPKGCRAWALGILGLAGGFGAGIPLALLPLAGLGQGGWRWLYLASMACLPIVARCRRQLPESRRWREAGGAATTSGEHGDQVRAGAVGRRWGNLGTPARRLALVCTGAALVALFVVPAGQFETQFLRHERHYSALAISLLEQTAGTLGALGVLFGGRLADTHGRRPVAAVSVAGATVFTLAAYSTRSALMWAASVAAQFFLYAIGPALGVYGAELFATASRARSAGLVAASAALGAVAGTVATAGLDDVFGNFASALAVMALGPAVLVALLILAYPETVAQELEDLAGPSSPAKAAGPAP